MKNVLLIATLAIAGALTWAFTSNADAQTCGHSCGQQCAQQGPGNKARGTVITLRNDNSIRPGNRVKRLTVLDFNATWCGPCQEFKPVFKAAAQKYTDVNFISIDVDQMPNTSDAWEISAIPTVIFIKPDGTTERYQGTGYLLPESSFFELVERFKK
ncbi:MAG: thioredoxin domain-containing protein [Muribaculaceae bacterium]